MINNSKITILPPYSQPQRPQQHNKQRHYSQHHMTQDVRYEISVDSQHDHQQDAPSQHHTQRINVQDRQYNVHQNKNTQRKITQQQQQQHKDQDKHQQAKQQQVNINNRSTSYSSVLQQNHFTPSQTHYTLLQS